MLEETQNILNATQELISLEEQVYLYNKTLANKRGLPLVVAGIGALSIVEIGVSCSDKWYGDYSKCYNTAMAGDCNIYNDNNEIVGKLPCKNVKSLPL